MYLGDCFENKNHNFSQFSPSITFSYIGSNREHSIEETFNFIRKIMNKEEVKLIKDEKRIRPENSEVHRLWCDNTLVNQLTGFKPEYSFEAGLKETVDWFLNPENLKRYKVDIYNV